MDTKVERYDVIDKVTGTVINAILWDGQSTWIFPEGTYLKKSETSFFDFFPPDPKK